RAPPGAPHHPRGVVPAGPFAGGGLHLGGGFPWPQVAGDLGLVQADDALGQRVVIGIPDGPDRRGDARGGQLGAVADGQVLAAGVGVVDQPGHLDALAGPVGDRHHQCVQHQAGVVAGGGAPPGDQPGERVDDERGIGGARPGGYEGEAGQLQPVRGVRREAAVDQILRPVLRRVRDRRPRLLPPAAAHPAQPQLAHQPLHGAPGRRVALAVELVPHLPRAVAFPAVLIDPQDLLLQRGVTHRPRRGRPRPRGVVPRRRDGHAGLAQRPADRPDPELVPEGLDEGHHQGYRWPSSAAKKALAVRNIAFTRRSSAFSRSSARIRAASADAVPGRIPRSTCACLAQPRSVSALIPSSPPTFRQAAVTLASWSLTRSSTSRTARSRSSSGYFRAAPIFPLSRGLGASTKPGAIQRWPSNATASDWTPGCPAARAACCSPTWSSTATATFPGTNWPTRCGVNPTQPRSTPGSTRCCPSYAGSSAPVPWTGAPPSGCACPTPGSTWKPPPRPSTAPNPQSPSRTGRGRGGQRSPHYSWPSATSSPAKTPPGSTRPAT